VTPDDEDRPQEPDELPPEADLPLEKPTVDSGTRKGHKRQIRKADLEQQEEAQFWDAVFSDRVGRRVMWKLLQEHHPFETRFGAGPSGVPDEYATWFAHGQASLGMKMFQDWLIIAREGVCTMLDEHDTRFSVASKKRRGR
jgi:hypothetical protein